MTNHEKSERIADMLMRKEIYNIHLICIPPMQGSPKRTLEMLTEDIEEGLDAIDKANPPQSPIPQPGSPWPQQETGIDY